MAPPTTLTTLFRFNAGGNCSICLEPLGTPDNSELKGHISSSGVAHIFHNNCLEQAFIAAGQYANTANCPYCRESIQILHPRPTKQRDTSEKMISVSKHAFIGVTSSAIAFGTYKLLQEKPFQNEKLVSSAMQVMIPSLAYAGSKAAFKSILKPAPLDSIENSVSAIVQASTFFFVMNALSNSSNNLINEATSDRVSLIQNILEPLYRSPLNEGLVDSIFRIANEAFRL